VKYISLADPQGKEVQVPQELASAQSLGKPLRLPLRREPRFLLSHWQKLFLKEKRSAFRPAKSLSSKVQRSVSAGLLV
jgi:hypothetical protein